jgi:hypothetical protein
VDSLEVEARRVLQSVTEGTFTPAQFEAITAADGPLGIIAGPGCGKTTGATRFPETMFSTTTLNLWGMGS